MIRFCFLKYFEQITECKRSFDNRNCVYKYLENCTGGKCRFADLTPQFSEKFKNFLLESASLLQNTASNYFGKFKVAVRSATVSKKKILA